MKVYRKGGLWLFGALLMLVGSSCEKGCGKEYAVEMDWRDLQQGFDIDHDEILDVSQCAVSYLSHNHNGHENLPRPSGYQLCGGGTYKFLVKEDQPHYLQSGSQVMLHPASESGLHWRSGTHELITNYVCEGLYHEAWDLTNNDQFPHFIGVKKEDSTAVQLGWVKLDYNLKTGAIEILETELRSDTLLVFE